MRSMLEKAEKENRSLNESESVDFGKLKDLVKQMTDEISKYEAVADEERNLNEQSPTGRTTQHETIFNMMSYAIEENW